MTHATFIASITRSAQQVEGYSRASMRAIATETARESGLTLPAMMDRQNKARAVSWPRQEAMRRIRKRGYSLPQIAAYFGFDHTTIIHGIAAATKRHAAECGIRGEMK